MGTPSIITALKDKAQIVRDIAWDMNLAFTENAVEDRPELVRFVFGQDFSELQKFLLALPVEVFAYRGVIGSVRTDQAEP